MKQTLCLNMIVKDEAHIITKTFDNLLKYFAFDYYVISDTGSTDGTQDLIKEYFTRKNFVIAVITPVALLKVVNIGQTFPKGDT